MKQQVQIGGNDKEDDRPSASRMCVLRLYVAGEGSNSLRALANLESLRARLDTSVVIQLEVIDVLESPERGLADRIILTPTLLRVSPLPVRFLAGDLSDHEAVLTLLGLPRAMP